MVAVGLAEMGDKTQLSILLLSSRTKEYFKLLLGVILAFLIVDGVAILLGSWITNLLPAHILKLISAAVFIGFGLIILFKGKEEEEGEASFKNPFISGFTMIFLSEWGDKTQIGYQKELAMT
jgi:Ca2+/H+ antiporter, TMEM165/GDT1 family